MPDTSPKYPAREWFEAADNFERWSTFLNMKFAAQASRLVAGADGAKPVPLSEAVDRLIAETAASLVAEGIPPDIVAAFEGQYGVTRRTELLDFVCAWAVDLAPALRPIGERKAATPGRVASPSRRRRAPRGTEGSKTE